MGYYIQTDGVDGKARAIVSAHNGMILPIAPKTFAEVPEDKALVVVVNNGPFEAAGLAFDEREFEAFTLPTDRRTKQFVLLEKQLAYDLSGFKK